MSKRMSQPFDFESFFRDTEPPLRRALVARLGAQRGREATAEALAWAFEHQDALASISNPMGYLYRVGSSRTRARRPIPSPARSSLYHEMPEPEPELWREIARLSPSQRVCVVLVVAYGYHHDEVAALLSTSSSTVNTHLRRGLRKLRQRLEPDREART